jgi:hypothetical protein
MSLQITVAARSKARNILARLNIGIVGSNPTSGMDVRLRVFVLAFSCIGIGLATGQSLIQGVLPTVFKIRDFQINSET